MNNPRSSATKHNPKKTRSFRPSSKSKPVVRPISNDHRDDPVNIWSNLAFMADDDHDHEEDHICRSSIGSNDINGVFSDSSISQYCCCANKHHGRSSNKQHMTMSEEEVRLREELAREIEKELEREIMEGIVVLVHRLSDLKAKQIVSRGLLKNFVNKDLDGNDDEFN